MIVPNVVFALPLDPYELAIYLELRHRAGFLLEVQVAVLDIARSRGICRSKTHRVLASLVERKLIAIHPQQTATRDGLSEGSAASTYELLRLEGE